MDVMMAHIVAAAFGGDVGVGARALGHGVGEVEDYHLRAGGSQEAEAVSVRDRKQAIVAIDKLQVLGRGGLDACVAGFAQTLMELADIDDAAAILHKGVDRANVRPIIDHDDLAFGGCHSKGKDAVDALAEQMDRQIITGDNEAD